MLLIDMALWQVMRILPRLNEDVNEEWLSDKGRFQYDGLKQQRLNVPLVKGPDGAFAPKRWPEALEAVAQGLQGVAGNEMKAIAGKLSDAESMVALKVRKALLRPLLKFSVFIITQPDISSCKLPKA